MSFFRSKTKARQTSGQHISGQHISGLSNQENHSDPTQYAIELRKISKAFGPVQANENVDLRVKKASIHGIVGENGAGKSTLMNILYGFLMADSGALIINGHPLSITHPSQAIRAGIGMVHQHFMLVDNFTVMENIILGAEGAVLLDGCLQKAHEKLQVINQTYGLNISMDTPVGDLPVGEQQRVEIFKALYRDASILILDEPTGVLTPQEAEQLFQILSVLKEKGVTILLITHKLQEIMDITDYVSVMRGGKMIMHHKTSDTTRQELAEQMVGRKMQDAPERGTLARGDVMLRLTNVSYVDTAGIKRLDNLNFSVCAGEIVAIAGVTGNGQTELLRVLTGLAAHSYGQIQIKNQTIGANHLRNANDFRKMGLAHVPEDRLRDGIISTFSVAENSILGCQNSAAYNGKIAIKKSRIRAVCSKLMGEFDVRPRNPDLLMTNLSGGNQQKLVLARELHQQPEILLVGQPTRGVDIGAIEFIHSQILAKRNDGAAIILVSVELDEILALADRVLVMFEGRIVGELSRQQADKPTLGLMMANAHHTHDVTAMGGLKTPVASPEGDNI